MADVVDSTVLLNGKRKYIVHLTNVSDGTGESAVAKVIKANLTNLNGSIPGKLSIVSMRWNIGGFSSVKLFWDHTTPDEIMMLTGNGFEQFNPPIADPGTAGGTGNITVTTAGAVAGAVYDITLEVLQGN